MSIASPRGGLGSGRIQTIGSRGHLRTAVAPNETVSTIVKVDPLIDYFDDEEPTWDWPPSPPYWDDPRLPPWLVGTPGPFREPQWWYDSSLPPHIIGR